MVIFDRLPINDAWTRTNDKLILTNAERKRLSNGDPCNLPGSRAPQMIKSQSMLSISSGATRRDRPGMGPWVHVTSRPTLQSDYEKYDYALVCGRILFAERTAEWKSWPPIAYY